MIRQARYRLVIAGLVVLLASTAVNLTQSGHRAQASARLLAVAISCSNVTHTPGNYVVELESSGQPRQFRLHIPQVYLAGNPASLVINLHGLGGSGIQQDLLSGMSAKADEAGFIAVHPEGRGDPQSWYVGPAVGGQQEDVQFIRDLINCLKGQLTIDADRIYATGFSNGGGMVNRLGCDLADVIAAIGPVSGAYLSHDACQPTRPVPVVAFHGTADEIVPYEGGEALPPIPQWASDWAVRNGCVSTSMITYSEGDVTGETWGNCTDEAVVTLYTITGGKHWWPGSPGATQFIDATDTIWEFFSAHPFQHYQIYMPLVSHN
jgi:polyhydroxybutyrate depolymerase